MDSVTVVVAVVSGDVEVFGDRGGRGGGGRGGGRGGARGRGFGVRTGAVAEFQGTKKTF